MKRDHFSLETCGSLEEQASPIRIKLMDKLEIMTNNLIQVKFNNEHLFIEWSKDIFEIIL